MLNDKELQILKLLRENARATVTEIAHKTNLPRSTVYEKIKKFRQSGIVSKYSCLISFNQLGLPISVKVLFKVDGTDREKLGNLLADSPHTNNVVKLGNEFDYLSSFMFSSMEDLHKYIDELNGKCKLQDYRILYVAKELKREGFLG